MAERYQHAWDHERAGSWLTLRVSLHNDPAPLEGLVDPPFRWDDVLRSEPPGERERGPPTWCVPGPELLLGGERLEPTLLLHRADDGSIVVEDRLSVTRRAMAPAIETERETVGARLEDARAAAKERAELAPHPIETAIHHGHAGILGFARKLTRGIVTVPDRLASGARRAAAFLATPEGRRKFLRGAVDPADLSAEQKAVTLFVGMSAVLAALIVVHFVVTLAVPDLARPWRTLFLLFLYGFVTSVGAPLPIEPALLPAAMNVGVFPAVAITLLAKVVAAWMVFFLGDEVNDRLQARAERSPRLRRALDASERFAKRFGLFAIAAFIATPGLPDIVALYVFGSLRMPLWKFLLGVAIGGAVLYTALTMGLLELFSR